MKTEFTLTLTKGPEPGKVFHFEKETVNIGRAAIDNDLILNNQSVSSHHARISFSNDCYFLQDFESTNGTLYNGRLLGKNERVKLETGADVCFGSICFKFDTGVEQTQKAKGQTSLDKTVLKKIPSIRKTGSDDSSPSQALQKQGFKKKPVIIAALCVGVFLILVIILKTAGNTPSSPGPSAGDKADLSAQPIEMPAQGGYGYLPGQNIYSRQDKAIFLFPASPGSLYLNFTPGYIDRINDVAILLNGKLIAYAPPAPKSWGREKPIHIPRSLLLPVGKNTLEFDNTANPPESNQWAVKNLSISVQTECPCNIDEASRLFDLGNNLYNERSVSIGNLSAAANYDSDALLRLDQCEPLPDIYSEIAGNLLKCREEIMEQYNNIMFIYKKAVKIKDVDGQIQSLENVLRLIPDSKDSLHESAYTELVGIRAKGSKNK